jgi:hypothetical protein
MKHTSEKHAASSSNRGRNAVLLAMLGFVLVSAVVTTLFVIGYRQLLDARNGNYTVAAASTVAEETATSYEEVAADSGYDATAVVIDTEEYNGTVLALTEDVGEEYVNNTLFIGDSNTNRYMNYGFTTLENDIGIVGMSAANAATSACVKFASYADCVTIPRAVALMQPQRILFGFGTNDLTGDVSLFVTNYTRLIQKVEDAYPYCDVIVNAIPPVARARSYTSVTMQQVDTFNAALVQMCEENGWKFLNSSEALKDPETGFCKEGYTIGDGLHLSQEGCTALFEYIRTHAWETEDRRPKPLDEIPVHEETPIEVIEDDPLKDEEETKSSRVEVTFIAGEGGTISGTTEQSVEAGGTCSKVTAVAKKGYMFTGWSCTMGSIKKPQNETIQFVVPSSGEVYGGIFVTANFAKATEATATPSPTAEPTLSPTPTATPLPTATPTPSPTATPISTPNKTNSPTNPTPMRSPTPNPTGETTTRPTPSSTPEREPITLPSASPKPEPTATTTPSVMPSASVAPNASGSPSASPSPSVVPSATPMPTIPSMFPTTTARPVPSMSSAPVMTSSPVESASSAPKEQVTKTPTASSNSTSNAE